MSSLARGNGSCHADHPRQCCGEWQRPNNKGVKQASNEINVLSRNISPMWIAYLHLSHSITMSAMQHSHKNRVAFSQRLEVPARKDIDRLSARVPVYRWLVEGCLVSSPPSIPKALSVYNWYEMNKCSRNLTTPGKVAISKLAIGNWRLSSFHRSLGVISFNKNWYKEPCSVLALSWQDWVFQPVAMMRSSRPQLQLQDMAKQCQACLFVSTKAEFETQTELYSWGSFTAAM